LRSAKAEETKMRNRTCVHLILLINQSVTVDIGSPGDTRLYTV